MIKVLVSDPLPDVGLAVLHDAADIDVDVRTGLKPDELKEIIGEYEGLIIRSGTKVTAEVIAAAHRLRIIGRAGVGVENVDVDAASKKGIVVMNTPGGNNVTTGEHTISLMLALARHIPQAVSSLKSGRWDRQKFTGVEVCNKTLGVVGLGNVGRIVAERALGLRMKVLGYDPFIPAEAAARMGVESASLDEIYRRSDFITVHVPLIEETRGLIDREAFARMKTGVRIINCARGRNRRRERPGRGPEGRQGGRGGAGRVRRRAAGAGPPAGATGPGGDHPAPWAPPPTKPSSTFPSRWRSRSGTFSWTASSAMRSTRPA